ncbi:membrane hypothetical protein [metagenome]|uniref:RDD domain-containing protein n=1 Tax=metagenome TaxID=256318 RepID=A0A2P2C6N2_9ZZZZ
MSDTPTRAAAFDLSRARPAPLFDRFVARLIDDVVLFAVNWSLLLVTVAAVVTFSNEDDLSTAASAAIRVSSGVFGAAIYLGYFTYFESRRGRTLGKTVMKLRTIGPDDGLPTTEQAARRNLWMGFPLLAIIPGIGGLLALVVAFGASISIAMGIGGDAKGRQAWHDHFAGGTRVVKLP